MTEAFDAEVVRRNLRAYLVESYMSITLLSENRGREAEIQALAEKWADEQLAKEETNE